ncbi:MAG: RNA polymerase sporulation sigma factor SigK [Eubacteriaceae bacterium]|nr:RNA polymerase sporulation sigma factor SigK [Eubacteriaceae bacterium]
MSEMFLGVLALLRRVFFFLGYFSPSKSFEARLSKEEEEEYIRLMCEQKDPLAREKLITHNLRLVAHVSKKYSTCPISKEDLLSIGIIGLIKGINTYIPEKSTKFASYLARCIDNEILMAIRSEGKHNKNVYLSDVIGSDEEGNNITFTDVVRIDDDDDILRISREMESSKVMKILKKSLDEREYEIINERYGLNGKKRLTQSEIAKKLNISRSYVSRIEKKAVEKLSKAYEKYSEDMGE